MEVRQKGISMGVEVKKRKRGVKGRMQREKTKSNQCKEKTKKIILPYTLPYTVLLSFPVLLSNLSSQSHPL